MLKTNFALWLIKNLEEGKEVKVVVDQFITPTLNTNLANMLLEIAERKLSGIFHLAGAKRVSRYDFAVEIAKAFDLDEDLIRKAKMEEMKWIAKRPRDSSLDVSKAKNLLNRKPMDLKESLSMFFGEFRGF
ncbi:MAG: sugar nucleotide-binding protein [Archaeoglobaceae archaeon]